MEQIENAASPAPVHGIVMPSGRSIVGDRPEGRPEEDFYPTPAAVTKALLDVESFGLDIWEPACGDGAICSVLEASGHKVTASDLIDRGYGKTGVNYFEINSAPCRQMITNPPFILAEDWVKHAKALKIEKFALLVKLAFLEGVERSRLLQETGLSRVWVFKRRVTFTRNGEEQRGTGMIAFAWFVWDKHGGPPTVGWIDHTKTGPMLF